MRIRKRWNAKRREVSWWVAKEEHLELRAATEELENYAEFRRAIVFENGCGKRKKEEREEGRKTSGTLNKWNPMGPPCINMLQMEWLGWSGCVEHCLINLSSVETWVSSDYSVKLCTYLNAWEAPGDACWKCTCPSPNSRNSDSKSGVGCENIYYWNVLLGIVIHSKVWEVLLKLPSTSSLS